MTDITIHVPEPSTENNSLRQELKDIGSRSTVHGISNVISTPSIYKKILWIISFLACTGLVIRQLVDIFILYRSYPIKTTFKLELNKEFPSITICNLKRYIPQREEIVKQRALELAVEEYGDRMGNFTTDQLFRLCWINNTCDFWDLADNLTRHLISEHEENIVYLTSIVYCVQGVTAETCDISYTWMSTVYGACATFEPTDKLAEVYGFGGEVSIVVNLDNQYGFLSLLTSGVRVVVHAKGTLALAYAEGVTIKGGDEAFIRIKLTCMSMCWEGVLLNKCGCIITETESLNYRTAAVRPPSCFLTLKDMCHVEMSDKLFNNPGSFCDCPAACTEEIYEMQVSSSKAFDLTDPFSRIELDSLFTMSCTAFYGAAYLRGCPLDSIIKKDTNFVKLHFYLRDPMHETRQEEPLYGESQMLADIGGSLGLFIGASVLSFGEIIEVFGVLLNAFYWKKRDRTTMEDTRNE